MRYFLALLTLGFLSCQTKKDSNSNKDADTQVQQTLDGDYEFYAGAIDDGYLYYKLSLTQNGKDLSGSLFTGIYLSKNDEGYTMPASTMTSTITGQLGAGSEVVLYLGSAMDTMRIERVYKYPEPEKIFEVDANGDPVISLQKMGSDFQWIHNGDTLLFARVATTKSP